jgi:ribA/ribD-fused uncharacterized protein
MIDSFTGEFAFLSNFSPHEVAFELTAGNFVIVPTVEHAFAASKTRMTDRRLEIISAPTPGKAKRIGRKVVLREDWENIKLSVMEELLRDKFSRHDALADKLVATGNQELIEGNHWHDTFWGVCNGIGENMLGKLLMDLRDEINMERGNAV